MATKKPTKKTSVRALTGPRILTKQIENADMVCLQDGINLEWHNRPTTYSESEWQGITNKAMVYNEQYIDLSGYELDDLTLAVMSCQVQDPGAYQYSGDQDVFCIYDIVSQERLSEDDLKLMKTNCDTFVQAGPGQSRGPLDRSQIVSGSYRLMTKNANVTGLAGLMLTNRNVSLGSGEPTAVQKLWVYRIVMFLQTPSPGDFLCIPASTFVLVGEVFKESELVYMQRLKRSYELATGN